MNNAFSIIPLAIEARGEIITNNLPEFRELVREALGNINRDLVTDEQFGQAELDVKALKDAEDAVRSAAVKAFDDQLKALVDGLNETAEEIRVPRLELEKIIAARKDAVKSEIVEEVLAAFDIEPRDARRQFLAGMQNAIKGKRTLESMRTACRIYQAEQHAMILASRDVLNRFEAKFGADSIPDRRELELKSAELVEAELVRRVQAKKAADEAAKLRAELAEANKPAPTAAPDNMEQGPWKEEGTPNVELPTSNVEKEETQLTADEEWKAFKAAAMAAFAPLKAAKAKLVYPKNTAKAQVFANAINAAWQEVMS